MVGFMTSRRALAVSAAFITAGIFAFLLATSPTWRAVMGSGLPWSSETAAPKTADDSTPAPQTAVPGSARVASVPGPVAAAPPATPAATDPPKPTEMGAAQEPIRQPEGPSFDIVRVDPNGESVIAARAKPGADIVLLDGGRPIAHAKANASGQVAFLPPTLSPGEHSLMLSVGEPNSPDALSSQSVAVSVPVQPTAPPMVALIQPDQPAQVLSGPVAGSGAPDVNQSGSASATTAAVPAVAISAIEVEDLGSFYASGKAAPGSHCRVYLNGSFVATVTAGKDGVWSLKIRRGMKPGHYVVRADQVEAADGKVQARAEVPFDYPARAAKAISLLRPKPGQTASPAGTMPGANSQTPASGVTKPAIPTDQVASNDPSSASLLANGQSPSLPKAGSTNPVSGVVSSKPATGGSGATKVANADVVSASNPGATVIAQLLTTKVVHGDSLWRISRKILGHGERYTQIYAANTTQIRDPRLIYPGQIFVMPQLAVP